MEQSMSDTVASEIATLKSRNLFEERNLPAYADIEPLRWKVLIDCDGERIGTIESISVDEDTGRVEFVEVGRGGFLGFGADRFLVPVIRIVQVAAEVDDSDLRWTVDTADDLAMVRGLYEALGLDAAVRPYREVVAAVRARPELAAGNAHVRQKPWQVNDVA